MVWVKKYLCERITSIDSDFVAGGITGTLGKIGSVIFRLKIDDTMLTFNCCNLPAGKGKYVE
jgi:hypothetical protein